MNELEQTLEKFLKDLRFSKNLNASIKLNIDCLYFLKKRGVKVKYIVELINMHCDIKVSTHVYSNTLSRVIRNLDKEFLVKLDEVTKDYFSLNLNELKKEDSNLNELKKEDSNLNELKKEDSNLNELKKEDSNFYTTWARPLSLVRNERLLREFAEIMTVDEFLDIGIISAVKLRQILTDKQEALTKQKEDLRRQKLLNQEL